MNIKDISTQLLYTTVPIFAQRKDNTVSAGTGFIFSVDEGENKSIPLLITSYHVLEDALAGFVELHIGEHGKPTNKTVRVQFDRSIISENKLGELDVIAIPLASTLMNFQSAGVEIFFRSVDQNMIPSIEQEENLAAIENITFIGYPSSIYDEKNKLSIVRKGITATPIWNSFRGEETFLIDAVTGTPIVILGTKCPSITSICSQSAPAFSARIISCSRFAKSAESIDGEIIILFMFDCSEFLAGKVCRMLFCIFFRFPATLSYCFVTIIYLYDKSFIMFRTFCF